MSPVYLLVLGYSLLAGQSVRVNGITLSGYEDRGGREKEIQADNPKTEATTKTSTQQSCQPDIHSVLREMSAVLAELKVERRHTKTAVNNLESRLRASESQVEELKKKVEVESHINQERKVVFSASLSGGEAGNHGPYSTDVTLVYKHVFINIGKAYNPVTGIFTAPVRGVYEFKIYAYGYSGRGVSVSLQKNGHHEIIAHAYEDQYVVHSSNGVSLLLEVGDVVCVKVRANYWIYDDGSHHSTFSGQMLFPV